MTITWQAITKLVEGYAIPVRMNSNLCISYLTHNKSCNKCPYIEGCMKVVLIMLLIKFVQNKQYSTKEDFYMTMKNIVIKISEIIQKENIMEFILNKVEK